MAYGKPPGKAGQPQGKGFSSVEYKRSLGSTQGLQTRGTRDFGARAAVPGPDPLETLRRKRRKRTERIV